MRSRRGTSNGNERGNTLDRLRRRRWLLDTYKSNVEKPRGATIWVRTCRCWRCGLLLSMDGGNTVLEPEWGTTVVTQKLTVDRIIPGAHGGTYRRNNIRPACPECNSETGGAVRRKRTW